ncbi:MAG: tetratricopeptide repeat protein [Cyanobacteria bacterium]|nr:tetratricopeptide repeat protein [Cyanobacteriota bacterium]
MEFNFASVYIGILLVLLSIVAVLVIKQVFKTRRIETTLAKLERQVASGQATPLEHYELGSLYLDKKIFTQAIAQFQQALKAKDDLEPGNLALIYNALGYAYIAQEQYDLAIRNYKEATKLEPDYVTAWNNLGFAYEKKQLTAQALDAYDSALKADPTNDVAKRRAASLRRRLVPSS